MAQPVPRHCEIKEFLARSILKKLSCFNKTRQPTSEGRQGCVRATLARRGLRFSLARNFWRLVVFEKVVMHTNLISLFLVAAFLVASKGGAASYSTEATMSLHKNEGTLDVDVRVARLVEQGGEFSEQLVAAPKIKTAPGVPATLYTGLQPSDPDFASKENVTVDVSWPYPNESGTAFCAVTIKLGSEVVSRSKLQLKIEGPGRVPLVLAAQDVDPKSVRIVDEKSLTCILLEFVGKTREEVKKLAIANYGNKVHIRDLQGRVTEGGLSFGTYHETGMTLHYASKEEAELVASILRGKDFK